MPFDKLNDESFSSSNCISPDENSFSSPPRVRKSSGLLLVESSMPLIIELVNCFLLSSSLGIDTVRLPSPLRRAESGGGLMRFLLEPPMRFLLEPPARFLWEPRVKLSGWPGGRRPVALPRWEACIILRCLAVLLEDERAAPAGMVGYYSPECTTAAM